MNRDLIKQAFPNQPRMQAAFESLVADAEAATARVQTALEAITGLSSGAEGIVTALAAKQPKNEVLDAISLLGPDPGALEQVQAGIFAVRPIDAADVKSLLTRELADTRYLGGNHGAASAAKLTTARNIAMSGDVVWTVTFDGSANVTAAGTIQSHAVTFAKLVAATQKALIGANAAGNFQEITLGSGLSLAAGVLTATGSGGTVTAVTGTAPIQSSGGAAPVISITAASGAAAGSMSAADFTKLSGIAAGATVNSTDAFLLARANHTGTQAGSTVTGAYTAAGMTMATARLLGRTTAATGAAEEISIGAGLTLTAGVLDRVTQTTVSGNAGTATTLQTSRNIDGQAFNGSADITVIAPGTHAATSKATPVDADELPLVDSAASNVLKKLTWANLKATLKTYLDTLYQPLAAALTSWAAVTRAAGFDTFTATPSSANLRALLTDETGTGAAVFAASPTFTGTVLINGVRQAGNSWLRVEGTGAVAPTGATGDGMNFYASGGAGVAEAYNYTTLGYIPFGFNGSAINFKINGTTVLSINSALGNYANDAAAAAGSVPVGGMYRNGSALMVRVT